MVLYVIVLTLPVRSLMDEVYKCCHTNLLFVHLEIDRWNKVWYNLHPNINCLEILWGWMRFGWNMTPLWMLMWTCHLTYIQILFDWNSSYVCLWWWEIVTLFKSITMLCSLYVEYWLSHITLLWIWIIVSIGKVGIFFILKMSIFLSWREFEPVHFAFIVDIHGFCHRGSCMVPLTHVMVVIRGLSFHPLFEYV